MVSTSHHQTRGKAGSQVVSNHRAGVKLQRQLPQLVLCLPVLLLSAKADADSDYTLIRRNGRAYSIGLDVNLDGKVDNEDLALVRARAGR